MNNIMIFGKLIDKPVFYEGPIGRGFTYFKIDGWSVSASSFLEEGASYKKEEGEFDVMAYGHSHYSFLQKSNPGDGMIILGNLQKDYARYIGGFRKRKENLIGMDDCYKIIQFISVNEDGSIDPIGIIEKKTVQDCFSGGKLCANTDQEKYLKSLFSVSTPDDELPF